MYERDDIELYLPCVWDEGYWTNPPRKKPKSSIDPTRYRQIEPMSKTRVANAIEPEKRTGTINPKFSNTTWAELIDVKSAWLETGLTLKERRALFLAYGLSPSHRFTHEEVAFNQGCSRQAITARLGTAINKMLAHLNGEEYETEEAVA
jgi:hypothetical protein